MGAATCTPLTPPTFNPSASRAAFLIILKQSGSTVTADLPDASGADFTGTVDAAGHVTLGGRYVFTDQDSIRGTGADTLSGTVSGSPSALTATGVMVGTGLYPNGTLYSTCRRSASWSLAPLTQPIADATPIGCSQEATLRSGGTLTSTFGIFRNNSSRAIKVYALDAAGARVFKLTVPAGGRAGLQGLNTVREPWVVTDAAGTCLGIYMAAEGPEFITVS
jgi:hypothetical protein